LDLKIKIALGVESYAQGVYNNIYSICVKRLGVRNVHVCRLRIIRSMYNMYEEKTVEGCFFNTRNDLNIIRLMFYIIRRDNFLSLLKF
jgi:hypothetical protein